MSASSVPKTASAPRSGQLFALLTGAFFVLFTLLPNSNSLMVSWPWVFLWQVGLLCPVLWLIAQVWQTRSWPKVGHGIDWLLGFIALSLILSSVLAEFPAQARWYGWATLGFIAALIVLTERLYTPEQRYSLLVKQGYLSFAFILVSLGIWITQTLLPELSRLRQLSQFGYEQSFDFSTLTLRNWAPLGHQNYVAGFLLLVLPLIVGLAILDQSKRTFWLITLGLGLVDLYTTSSRGGWLGLVVICVFGFIVLLLRSSIPRSRLLLTGAAGLVILGGLVLANNRLRTLIPALLQGDTSGELAYRVVTTVTGWQMGLDNWFAGAGLGSVPLLYQRYRPGWAGHLGELAYQLHGTPIQIWAELGLLGVLIMLTAVAIFVYFLVRWLAPNSQRPVSDYVLALCLLGGLLGYGALSLTDYQLDNVAISGMIVIYTAVLAAATPRQGQTSSSSDHPSDHSAETASVLPTKLSLTVLSAIALSIVTLIMVISLVPAHRAWQLSSQAFLAIDRDQPNWQAFDQLLNQAHKIAPWEPYYPNQLGWNFGNLPRTAEVEAEQAQAMIQQGIAGLQAATKASPYSEFGYTNLGWLLRDSDNAEAAAQAFAASASLVPAKRGVFFGLGLNLADSDQAIEAMALEILRDPLFVTSPIWLEPGLRSQTPLLLERVETKLDELITASEANADQQDLAAYWHQIQGGISWWQGDWNAAHAHWDNYGNTVSQAALALSEERATAADIEALPNSAAKYAMLAWLSPEQRPEYLDLAWLYATETPPIGELQTALLSGMVQSNDFNQWLQQNAVTRRYRNERLGFGTLSRHIDGPIPEDFWVIVENISAVQFFSEVFPTPVYNKSLDQSLQPWRDQLLESIRTKSLDNPIPVK